MSIKLFSQVIFTSRDVYTCHKSKAVYATYKIFELHYKELYLPPGFYCCPLTLGCALYAVSLNSVRKFLAVTYKE